MRNSLPEERPLKRYGIALACVASAFLLVYSTWPLLQPTSWAPFILGVMVSAWFGGFGPGLFAVAASAAVGQYFLFVPYGSFTPGPNSVFRTLVFMVLSLFTGFLVSSKRKSERFERAERKRFQATVASIGDAVIATDRLGRVTFMNGVAEELTAWPLAEAAGRPLEDIFVIVNETTRATVENPVQKVLETGRTQGLANHTILIARDGAERPIDDSAAPIKDDGGRLLGVVLVFHDVSQKREAEKALEQSEDYSRRIIESNSDCLKVVDLEGRLRSMNQNGCRLMEIEDLAPFIGLEWSQLWPVETRKLAVDALAAARTGKVAHFEGLCPTAKGTLKWWDVAVSPVFDASGKVLRFLSASRDITDRKTIELALRAANDRAEFVAKATNDAVWDWDLVTGEVKWNHAVSALFGYSTEQVGEDAEWWSGRIHPEDRERVLSGIHRVIAEGEASWRDEYRFLEADGSYAYVLDRGYAVYGEAGKTVRMVGAMLDLTERREMETELLDAKTRLNSALEAGAIATWTWDVVRNRVVADENLSRLFAVPPEAARGGKIETYLEAIHPADRERVTARISQVVERGSDFVEEYRIIRPGGGVRWVEARGKAVRDSRNVVVGLPGVVVDITDRKASEAAAKQTQNFQRLVFESVRDFSIFTTDLAGRITSWNEGAQNVFGYREAEVLGKPAAVVFTPEDRAAGIPQEEMRAAAETGRGPDERWHLKKDGTRFFASGSVTPLLDDSGTLIGFTKVARDITHRIQTEKEMEGLVERLHEADRRKDEFLAMLAHELRNPLSAIQSAASVAQKPDASSFVPAALDIIQRQTKNLSRLVADLLDAARISQGKLELRKEVLDVVDVVRQAAEGVRSLMEQKQQEFDLEVGTGRLLVDADPTRLEQAVGNLLTNAAKYTEADGRISLAVSQDGDQAVIRVKDSGVGISQEMLPKVFDLFTQVESSLHRSEGGLGIGLTLVKRLVELHGGTVDVESEQGHGSVFTIRLPLHHEAKAPDTEDEAPVRSGAGRRILVVDDNIDSAQLIGTYLELVGNQVRVEHDGFKAVETARQFEPEVVILDIGLPGQDGYQVARQLRAEPCCNESLIIAVSGYADEASQSRGREAGFDHHLAKPVGVQEIVSLISRSLP